MDEATHIPVMLNEVLMDLDLKPGGVVADGTLGLAGHAFEFAARIAPDGVLIGLDWDQAMLERAKKKLSVADQVKLHFVHADFREMSETLKGYGLEADGILLDLGLNSAQIEDPERGISFREAGPLDMRMDRSSGEPASALLNRWTLDQIEQVLHDLGDERWARAIARQVVARRKDAPLKTTQDLVDCVLAAIPPGARDKRIHPATRTFQAIRIATNRELEGLEDALEGIARSLSPGGTLVVLSYHSGEDRAVKKVFRSLAEEGSFTELHRKPLLPTPAEIAANPRSRSAKMRSIRRMMETQ